MDYSSTTPFRLLNAESGDTDTSPLFNTPHIPRALDFVLPPELEATMPPEARGLRRDDVRLMVSYRSDNRIEHMHFRDIGNVLNAGDVLVLNTSGTMNAALPVTRADGTALELHLSTHLPADLWSKCVCKLAR